MNRLVVPLLLVAVWPLAAQNPPAPAPPPAGNPPQAETAPQAAPRPKPPKDKDRWGWTARLQDDVSSAMSRTRLSRKQMTTLQRDLDALRQAAEAHRSRKKIDQGKVNKALVSIHNEFASKTFAMEDRDHVMEDLDHLPLKQKPVQERRQRPPRNPFPRPGRYPRW